MGDKQSRDEDGRNHSFMVNLHSHLDGIKSHLEEDVNLSERDPRLSNCSGKSHIDCGWLYSMGCGPGPNEKGVSELNSIHLIFVMKTTVGPATSL